jgi:predicted small lipoprotein YifL
MKQTLRTLSFFALGGSLAACGGKMTITPATLPNAVQNTAYTAQLGSSDGKAPFAFTLQTGTLPAGIALSKLGAFTGTPTATGDSAFTISGNDDASNSGTQPYTLTVLPQLKLDTTLPALREGRSYSESPKATGGVAPYVWVINGLPGGLQFDAATGVVSGNVPTTVPPKTLTIQVIVTDSGVPKQSLTALGSLQILPPSVSIATSSLPAGKVGQPYGPVISGTSHGAQLVATNGSGSFQWSITDGLLPDGLRLEPSSGVISGTPTAPSEPDGGAITLEITVTDTVSIGDSDKHSFPLSVLP